MSAWSYSMSGSSCLTCEDALQVLLEHMAEFNARWVIDDSPEGSGEHASAEASNSQTIAWHMEWLQSFCTTLVEKSLTRLAGAHAHVAPARTSTRA